VTSSPPPTDTALLRSLLLSVLAMAGANLAVFPLMAEIQQENGLSTAALGPIAGAAFLTAVLAQLLLAPYADRGRERHLLVGGLVATALSLAAMAVARSTAGLVAARALEGLAFGAFMPTARALVSRGAGLRIGERLGQLSAAELAGVAVGPLVSAWLSSVTSADTSLLVFAALALCALPLVVNLPIPMVRPVSAPEPATASPGAAASDETSGATPPASRTPVLALDLLHSRAVVSAVLLSTALTVPIGAYDTLWSRFMTDLGASTVLIGLSLTVFALPYVVLAGHAGKVADRLGTLPAALGGMAVTTAMMVSYGFVGNPWIVTGLGLVESTGQAFASPASQAAMAHATGPERAGAGQGLAAAVGTFAAGLTAMAAAPVYQAGGPSLLFCSTAAFVALLLVAAAWRGKGTVLTAPPAHG
jgi:MFS family permease